MPKDKIHFAHANGFPAKTYNRLFAYLEDDFEIGYLERHAHNPKFPVTDGWERLRDELREELENRYTQKIIGVGHSLGGILHFLTAVENPEFYKAIILLDAPIISRLSSAGIRILKRANLIDRFTPSQITRFRRSHWKTKEEAVEHFRKKEKFAAFDRGVLRDYVEHGTVRNEKGVRLFFKPKIEAEIYRTIPHNLAKFRGKLKVPAFYIGGTNSREARLARLGFMRKYFPFEFRFIKGSHLFPLEKPRETAEIIRQIYFKYLFTAEKLRR
ncbi:MAG: alpha/beta hydrolase [Acidobacteriota bacterium]|nr:alpha/beta hydrolase [Acidobacteriota bacterium]